MNTDFIQSCFVSIGICMIMRIAFVLESVYYSHCIMALLLLLLLLLLSLLLLLLLLNIQVYLCAV